MMQPYFETHPWRKDQSKAYLVDLLPRLSYSGSTGYGSKKNKTPKKTDPEWFWYILIVFGLSTNQSSINLGKLRTRATSPWWTSHTTAWPLSQAARCQVLVNLPSPPGMGDSNWLEYSCAFRMGWTNETFCQHTLNIFNKTCWNCFQHISKCVLA